MVIKTIEMINGYLNVTSSPNPIDDEQINLVHIRKSNRLARFILVMTQTT